MEDKEKYMFIDDDSSIYQIDNECIKNNCNKKEDSNECIKKNIKNKTSSARKNIK